MIESFLLGIIIGIVATCVLVKLEETMATQDVPGANAANADELHAGCWAEHKDGSLLFVKGNENGKTVYELYDMAEEPPVYYQDAMREEEFKKAFSHPPTGTSTEKWTWHDKSAFPWDRVMKTFDKPRPQHADVAEQLSAAAQVAKSLRLRAQALHRESVEPNIEQELPKGTGSTIRDKIQKCLDILFE